ncbi:MAG: glutamate formiminotransferase, partial [Actinomycetota bacterium]
MPYYGNASMSLIAIPNVSEGRDRALVSRLVDAVARSGARVLDVHIDEFHNRSVLTVTADDEVLVDGMVALAQATARWIDLTQHEGVHPRVGGLDVCPFVPHEEPMERAVSAARAAAERIGTEAGIPVYLYEEAA